jgi:predicted enzyme related to lactoylglutathione lyase
MPEVSSHNPGTFCWIDLSTTDADASKNFYSQILGWTAIDNPVGNGMVYSMMQKDGKNVCGLYEMTPDMEGVPPHWGSYISVTDVDAEVERITAAGGMVIMPPGDVFEAGRMAFVADPTGAAFGLWQAKEHIGAEIIYAPGSLGWNELYTADPDAAAGFYADVFGWTRATHQAGPQAQDYHEFKLAENNVGGMLQIQPEWGEVPPNWSVYFCVDDVEASLKQAQDMGAEVIVPVMSEASVRFAFLKDPQDIYFGIVQMLA